MPIGYKIFKIPIKCIKINIVCYTVLIIEIIIYVYQMQIADNAMDWIIR